MKVLVADTFEQSGLEAIEAAGCEVIYRPELADERLAEALASTRGDVLIVRSTQVTEAMLDASSLSLIVRAGAGVNTIDVGAASRRGIYVSNCPGKNAIAVAELTFALILALDRRIADNVADLRAGRWNKKEYSKARGLYGRSLGLLGFGRIGREVARRASAFGCRCSSGAGVSTARRPQPWSRPTLSRSRSFDHRRRSPNAPTSSASTWRWPTRRAPSSARRF
jgi:D-3-phosphoglycerate dehydrogenase